jgi:threonine/homoserine/homoserine lactone efflux protein
MTVSGLLLFCTAYALAVASPGPGVAVMGAYAFAASRARRLFTSSRAMTLLNRTTGAVMAGAAAVIVTK